jgi:hypothetical protein
VRYEEILWNTAGLTEGEQAAATSRKVAKSDGLSIIFQ